MAHKYLNTVQELSNSGLTEFLAKNGYGELSDILKNQEVNGKEFLDLTELNVLRWKLSATQKKKLLSCLTEVKANPQNFFAQNESQNKQNTAFNRNKNTSQQNVNIKAKLELVIGAKPLVPTKPANRDKTPQKSKIHSQRETPPPGEYLSMERPAQSLEEDIENHYDDSGYLLPLENADVEENAYEPPPSTPRTKFIGTLPRDNITRRIPAPLPRETIDGGYIQPDDIGYAPSAPSTFPRNQGNPNGVFPEGKNKLSSPRKPTILVQPEEETYEAVPDTPGKSPNEASLTPPLLYENTDFHMVNGTLPKRFIGFLKKKTVEISNLVQNDKNGSKTRTKSLDRTGLLKDRPLPALPGCEESDVEPTPRSKNLSQSRQNLKKGSHASRETLSESEDATTSPEENYSNMLESLYVNDSLDQKSKSENSLVNPQNKTYRNTHITPAKSARKPENYELYHGHMSQNSKWEKFKLPLPPTTLPEIPVDPEFLSGDSHEEEGEEYNNCVFNLNDEPFYRNTDRKGARQLLHDLEDGAFLFRPSKRFFLTLSLKYKNKFFNLGIEKSQSNKIRLNTEGDSMSPEFATISDFIAYFTREVLTFQHESDIVEIYLKKVLPRNRF